MHSSIVGLKHNGESLPEPKGAGDMQEMEFDEMWRFTGSKKTSFGSLKLLTVVQGELWPGCSAIVILQHSDDSMIK